MAPAKPWRPLLPQLQGLPLLPIGAGSDKKAPAHPTTGEGLKGWPTAAFTPEQVASACREVIAVGFRPGPDSDGLIAFDIDGATAIERCRSHGCDPLTAPTWQVRRDTDPDRLKAIWRIPADLRGALELTVHKLTTKPPSGPGARDGENVATYYGAGQVIVLGQHPTSGGNYFWPDGHGPAEVAEIPPDWWALADVIATADPQQPKTARASSSSSRDWRRVSPCPICGRDGHLICSKHRDGRSVLCYHGSTFSPPELKPGEVITGSDGERWAFTGSRRHGEIGDFSHFKIDEPREEPDYTSGFPGHGDPLEGSQVHGDASGGKPTTTSSKPIRLSTYDVKRLLPDRLGAIRRDVRSGDVMTAKGKLSGNEISNLYVALSGPAENWPKDTTADTVAVIASANTYDPVEQYLQGIATPPLPMEQWQRLDQHLLGIDHPIAAAFLPRYLISAVARTMEPGCYVRQVLVLIGPQERGKGALGEILFGAAHWIEGVGQLDRDARQRCHMAWGVELAELDGVIRRNDREKVKAFITEKVDTFQIRYDRFPGQHPRRFVFWGTSNVPPLTDSTGSTRFVCIEIPDRMLPLDWAIEHRDAIWARALEQYRHGVKWALVGEEERQAIEAMNSDYQEEDPWSVEIEQHLGDAKKYDRLPVTIPDLLDKLDVPRERQTKSLARRIREIAERQGWKHRRGRWQGSEPLKGLWPPEPSTVHGVHRPCTPTSARANASEGAGSGRGVHPVHPSLQTKGEKEEGEERQATHTSPEEKPRESAPEGVHGVHGVQTDRTANDQPVHTTRARVAQITGKPPTFNVNPWAGTDARPPRSDADRLHDRQAQQRTQHEVELLEQQMWDQTA